MPPKIQQIVKVVVGAQPEKKKRRKRRAAPKKAAPTVIERYIAHPGFAASQIVTSPSFIALKPEPFQVSALQEYQIQRQRERAGGMQTSLERIKELTGPKFDEDVVSTPKKPKVRQPTPAQAERAQAIAAFKEAFPNTPVPEGKKGSAKKLREAVAKKQDE